MRDEEPLELEHFLENCSLGTPKWNWTRRKILPYQVIHRQRKHPSRLDLSTELQYGSRAGSFEYIVRPSKT